MAYQPCRLEKLRVKSGASTIQNPQNSQIIKVSPTTTRVIMVLRDTWGGGMEGGNSWNKLQYLYPVLEGEEGLYHHQVTWGKQVLPKMAFPQEALKICSEVIKMIWGKNTFTHWILIYSKLCLCIK